MKRYSVLAGLVLALLAVVPAQALAKNKLQMYRVVVAPGQSQQLMKDGFDVAAVRPGSGGQILDVVASPAERRKLAGQVKSIKLKRTRSGVTVSRLMARQAAGGYNVWRSWSEDGGIEDEMRQIAADHPNLVELHDLGTTEHGRHLLALKVEKNAGTDPDGDDPGVLFSSTQHAREWISTEVNRRDLHYFVDNYGTDKQVTRLVNTRELWFVLVANPDGYDFTFSNERLWRKNTHEQNGQEGTQEGDGVDPNRNFPTRWNYDDEGSSGSFFSETYRGPFAASEPETQAMDSVLAACNCEFQVNYHSFGPLLLYTDGWQVETTTADDPIYKALSGDEQKPAIPGFDPGVGAELYTTNGETTDEAHHRFGTLAWTPELEEGCTGCGFVFPDDESLIQGEFEKQLPFALDVVESADDPANPETHLNIAVPDFKVHTFDRSFGDPQTVSVDAKRSLGAVSVKYTINAGPVHTASTSEWAGGERWGDSGDVYFHEMRGQVTGTHPGDIVHVWFQSGSKKSESFNYKVMKDSGARVLIMAAEDYTGPSPAQDKKGPHYLSYYTNALQANGVSYDVYDVDAQDRKAPDALGVLSHYDAVIWYTGDDYLTREPGQRPGTGTSSLANEEMLAVRSYLNEGGKLMYTGKNAGRQYAEGFEFERDGKSHCKFDAKLNDGCFLHSDDFLQYYLGSYVYSDNGGTDPNTGAPFPVDGDGDPFTGLSWSFGGDGAGNQNHTAAHVVTSSILPESDYPQFTSWEAANWNRPFAAPFAPFTGNEYMYSQRADVTYKRLTRTVDMTSASSGDLSFKLSRDTEEGWDYVFVEAHTTDNDWTTLPDVNGHTAKDAGPSDGNGSCSSGWNEIHPFIDHYQTYDGTATCTATGTTGEFNAATGRSAGWEDWKVDLSAYAGKQVELSITYVSDWSVQGLGAFVDDTTVTLDGSVNSTTSFEGDDGGWAVPGPPAGSSPNPNDWKRSPEAFDEGAVVATPDTLYFGFGFEGISSAAERNAVMGRSMDHLLP